VKGQAAVTDSTLTRALKAEGPIPRYLEARQRAAELGDRNLVREIDFQLGKLGYSEPRTADAARARETATPRKAR